nr:hypothetical protein [Tanacetum cinerariifolium]
MFRSEFMRIVKPAAKLVNGMVMHKDYLLRGSYHGNKSIFILNYHGVRWQVKLGRVGLDRVAVFGHAWSDYVRRNVDEDVRIYHCNWRIECTLHPDHRRWILCSTIGSTRGVFKLTIFNESKEAVMAKYNVQRMGWFCIWRGHTSHGRKDRAFYKKLTAETLKNGIIVIPSDIVKMYKLYGYASTIVTNKDAKYEFELRWVKVSNSLEIYSLPILRKIKEMTGFMAD